MSFPLCDADLRGSEGRLKALGVLLVKALTSVALTECADENDLGSEVRALRQLEPVLSKFGPALPKAEGA